MSSLLLSLTGSAGSGIDIPLTVSGLIGWYDATDPSTLTLSGSNVTEWRDKSGNDNHVSQLTTSNSPISGTRSIFNKNALDFDGDKYMDRNDILGLAADPNITVIVVSETDTTTADLNAFTYFGSSSGTGGECFFTSTGNQGYSWRFNNGSRIYGAANTGTPEILAYARSASFDYDASQFRINGGAEESETSTAGTSLTGLANDRFIIGMHVASNGDFDVSSNGIDGLIGEILIFNRNLQSAEFDIIHNYLSIKWGIAVAEKFPKDLFISIDSDDNELGLNVPTDLTGPVSITIVDPPERAGTFTTRADTGETLTAEMIRDSSVPLMRPQITGNTTYNATVTGVPALWIYDGAYPGDATHQMLRDSAAYGNTSLTETISFETISSTLILEETFDGKVIRSLPFVTDEYNPTNGGNNAAWYDASDLSTITADSSGQVSQWNDKSGNGNHVTQLVTNNMPTSQTNQINGINVLRFDPSSFVKYLDRGDALGFTGNSGMTIVIIGENIANDSGIMAMVYLGSNTNPTFNRSTYVSTGSSGYSWRFNDGNRVFGSPNTNTPQVLIFNKNNQDTYSEHEFRINGGAEETQTGSTNPDAILDLLNERMLIGTSLTTSTAISGNGFNGNIAEVQIYTVEISASRMNAILRAARNKWGITPISEVV